MYIIRQRFQKNLFFRIKSFYKMRVVRLFSLPVYQSPGQISIQEEKFKLLEIVISEIVFRWKREG